LAGQEAHARLLRTLFDAAIEAVDPMRCIPPLLPKPPPGRTVVLGAGKVSAAMARAVEAHWRGPLSGLILTPYGHAVDCHRIEIVEAAHPVPDEIGQATAARILGSAGELGADDLLLCLISGGGSALLALPAAGLTLADKQAVNRSLLRSGATISEMNCVRKHLSAIKGGRLAAAAAPARLVTLMISDVPGDDPAVIASGPTVPDPTTFADAAEIFEKYRIEAPAAVRKHMENATDETPKPGDTRFANTSAIIAATPQMALEAAAIKAEEAGYKALIQGDAIEGEAREVAKDIAATALSVARDGDPAAGPAILLSGGETTVTIKGGGRGGRNTEFLLALAIALDGEEGIFAIACDTDGIDGSGDNAGAVVAPDTLARAGRAGLDAAAHLADNDAYSLFEKLGDLVMTGPTLTNVNDFRAVLIEAASQARA
jgi:hydroxypyruvate reductase